ncbi:MAG: ABC transporter permease [Armatimonadetes bacterium]|nr:ABC transporter permease [Armatimonadota bacterium]
MSSPIADLTYRGYDGPLGGVSKRWWAIAKYQIKKQVKNRFLWVLMAASGWYYAIMIIIFFFLEQMAVNNGPQGEQALKGFLANIVWKDQFLLGFSFGQFLFFVMTWILGAASIANDNRANALLVYLSKPCTKADYLLGKWLGIFLPLLLMQLIPTLFFWLYGMTSFASYGFVGAAGWLILKMIPIAVLGSALSASVILGVSSMFNQGRIAGIVFAGLYMVSNFFTVFVKIAILFQGGHGRSRIADIPPALLNLFYCSIDGIQIAIAKNILGTAGSQPFGGGGARQRMAEVPVPSPIFTALIWLALCAAGWAIAWRRVRAVEVVG